MRLQSKDERDSAGFAIELVCRTIMSHPPRDGWNDEWIEALESLSTADPSGGAIVVVGRIFAKELDPFEKGQASFILSEVPVSDHGGADHDAESCPFCKRRMAKSPLASVRFVDENGGTLPFDARRIFGIKKGQVVVIKGRATSEISVGTPLLSLQADGLFVRNE